MIKPRFYLTSLFGNSVSVKILEILLQKTVEDQSTEQITWLNFSEIAKLAQISKSSSNRILESLIGNDFVEEKVIETHAQNPPRMVYLRVEHPAIKELLFFYRKVRGFL
jgi:predicted transcriptional regulator